MASGNTLLIWTPLSSEPPAADAAAWGVRNQHVVLAFDDATSRSAFFSAVMPRHYGGGGLTLTLGWMAASAVPSLAADGDAAGKFSDWSLLGASLANSENWVWYWDYVAPGSFPGQGALTLWKDAAKTKRVAQGSGLIPAGAGSATINLAAENGSGLSGSVTIGFDAPTDNDPDNTLAYPRVAWQAAFERHQDDVDDLDADSFAPVQTVYDIPASASGELSCCSVAFLPGTAIDGIAAGEHFRLKLTRSAGLAVGNLSGDAELLFVELKET